MIGKKVTGTGLDNKPITGTVMDKVLVPQTVQMGNPLQPGAQQMVMPFDAYLVRTDTGTVAIMPVIGITAIHDAISIK